MEERLKCSFKMLTLLFSTIQKGVYSTFFIKYFLKSMLLFSTTPKSCYSSVWGIYIIITKSATDLLAHLFKHVQLPSVTTMLQVCFTQNVEDVTQQSRDATRRQSRWHHIWSMDLIYIGTRRLKALRALIQTTGKKKNALPCNMDTSFSF